MVSSLGGIHPRRPGMAGRLLPGFIAALLFATLAHCEGDDYAQKHVSHSRPRALFAWGRNNAGQLGVGHTNDVMSPEIVNTFQAKHINLVAVGGADEDPGNEGFSLVVTSAGNLFAFGSNQYGQLGVGDTNDRNALSPVMFLIHDKIKRIATGKAFSLAVTDSGRVYAWGSNSRGQLGLGDLRDRHSPEPVSGALASHEVQSVTVGSEHAIALTTTGLLFAWGSNAKGQLGVGDQVGYQSSPVQILGAVTGIKFHIVDAGWEHTLAASKSGEIYCWGSNDWGQLGLGDLEGRPTPHAILHKFTRSKIAGVAAGGRHSMAITDGGDLFTWGSNDCGQLGYEMKGGRKYIGFPRRVETIRAARIKAGHSLSVASINTGRVFVWGCSHNGELGLGDVTSRTAPKVLPPPNSVLFVALAVGPNHVLATNKRGELWGWGKNNRGQLGLSYNTKTELKPQIISSAASTDVVSVTAGGFAYEYQGHAMALTASGKVFSWGWNAFGQLGLGTLNTGTATPSRVFALEFPVQVLGMAAGQYNTAVVTERKKVPGLYTWGPNYHGQLGQKFLELGPILEPARVEAMRGQTVVDVQMGYSHVLALTDSGTLFVWGNNNQGQLGTGDGKERSKPTPVTAFRGAKLRSMAAGQQTSYAVTTDGKVYAWGYNDNFELGLGEGVNRNAPQLVKGLVGKNVSFVAAGGYHALAVTWGGEIYAWGANTYGQLGVGDRKLGKTPAKVTLPRSVAPVHRTRPTMPTVSAGTWHTVAILDDGSTWTWGRAASGQLGHSDSGVAADVETPKRVKDLADSYAVGCVARASHTYVTARPGNSWVV